MSDDDDVIHRIGGLEMITGHKVRIERVIHRIGGLEIVSIL